MMNQLTLGISLRDDATFANFIAGRNETLVGFLQDFSLRFSKRKFCSPDKGAPATCPGDTMLYPSSAFGTFSHEVGEGINENMIYLGGSTGCGLSHLLQACCHDLTAHGLSCLFLPLKHATDLSPQILHGLDQLSLIAIDDIDAIAGQHDWEEELFHFYNRILHLENTAVIFSGHTAAKQLTIALPDLQSRLNNLLSLYVHSLEDHEKLAVLQIRAKARGLEVTKRVGLFLLNRCSRNMGSLFQILEKLDQASLIAQRKLTIPFVKSVLGI